MHNKIFIVGRNRSGTKWLSNLISNHPDVISVQREGAGGILETNLFKQYPDRFDLCNKEDRTAFEILFRESNFFKCANIKESKINFHQHSDFYSFFEHFMNELATENNTKTWLQKADSFCLPNLLKYFPDSKIVIIQRRNVMQNTISSMLLNSDKITYSKIIKEVSHYWMHRKIEKKYKNQNNIYFVEYEELKRDVIGILQKIMNHLNLPFSERMTVSKYKPNSSFKKYSRDQYYTKSNKIKIICTSFLISLVPLNIFLLLSRILNKRKISFFTPLTFSNYRDNTPK